MAPVPRVRRTTVYNCVKSKSYRNYSKPNIYKPKKIDKFSQGLGKVEQYQSDGQASKIENSNQQRYFINKKGFKMLT